jgi:trimeric autotransporter adhesin
VAVDGAGDLYIADTNNNRIRRVDPSGVITTVAGTGTAGFSGDDGPATEAELNRPVAVAVDDSGRLYIADRENDRVRRVDRRGVITTVAGTGALGYSGDGAFAADARLAGPVAVAVDGAGDLYIAEASSDRVRKVDDRGIISTLAGTGRRGFSGDGTAAAFADLAGPEALAVDLRGAVYVADAGNRRIRRVDSGIITTVAGTGAAGFGGDGGPAAGAQLSIPTGLAVDPAGDLYVADWANNRVRRVDRRGIITTVAGTGQATAIGDGGPATAAGLAGPVGVAAGDAAAGDAGGFFVGDWANSRVRFVDGRGTITTVAGTGSAGFSGDGGPATKARLADPEWIAVSKAGDLYIADSNNNRIRRVDRRGIITTVAGTGSAGFSGDGGPATKARLADPAGVAVDGAGNLYFADLTNNRIRRVDPRGTITTVAGTGQIGFSGDGGVATKARLRVPLGVAVDCAGNVFFADSNNNRIRRVDPRGTITTVAGTGVAGFSGDGGVATKARLRVPLGVAVDCAGNVFFADSNNNRIRRVNAHGTITTVAGTGAYAFSGDGGPGEQAQLANPEGVAAAGSTGLYIADWGNNRVRRLTVAGGTKK